MEKKLLSARALQLRIDSLRSTTASASGHPTTCMSAADIVSVLFFHSMHYDVHNPHNETNDRLIVSKGHGIPAVYAAYKQLGVISDDELMQLRQFDSPLEGHPTPRFVYNEAATGSLGQGLAIGAGMALHAKIKGLAYTTYVLLGDGELAEGSIWEAADFAVRHELNNLIAIVDCNRLGQTGETLYGHNVEVYKNKFAAFGYKVFVVDGHDIGQVGKAIEDAKAQGIPSVIIAKTYKGYGSDLMENENGFHGVPVKHDKLEEILNNLTTRFADAHAYGVEHGIVAPKIPANMPPKPTPPHCSVDVDYAVFGDKIATRKAFGHALATLKDIVVLDADVKNSTFTQIFEKAHPKNFFQCFIAEQTMVGVATGLQSRGEIPFAATFGAFLTRAHDQIRMAGIGKNALRLCGSHCGVSIGQDGPSQMGLEDLAMMRSIPDSVVLYPSDGVSTCKLVELMANYNDGISYMRTTRAATPILYDKDETFEVGGCKVLRQSDQDVACVVAAGITLFEALKAYDVLQAEGISVSVIDLYSVKPLDVATLQSVAKTSGNTILVVEDHYIEGGMSEAVARAMHNVKVEALAVQKLSRSAKPEELLAYAGIDAKSIVQKIKAMQG